MKFKSSTLVCSLLLAAASVPSFALDTGHWYAGALGNAAVIETTVGCVDRDMMWERHVVKADSWNNQWGQSHDSQWTFSLFNHNRAGAGLSSPEFTLDTSRLHDASGSTVDAWGNDYSVTFYSIRPYEPLTMEKDKNDDSPYFAGSLYLHLGGLDPQCDFYRRDFYSDAQNLVSDGSLEDTIKCPQSIGRFYHPTNTSEQYTTYWRKTTLASPDYHNDCGYSTFQANTGQGYAGILYYDPSEYREYISALLNEPLVAGEQYYLEYYVALAARSTLAIDEIQVHFSNGVPLDMTFPPPGPLALTAHLQASGTPTSTSYQKISGYYTATGGEDVITFGNFHDNANTTLTTVSASGSVNAYYYIDDVSLVHHDTSVTQAGSTLSANMSGATYQ